MSAVAECILLVENRSISCGQLKGRLAQRVASRVLVANNLQETRSLVSRHRDQISLAVCDYDLPDASQGEAVDFLLSRDLQAIVLGRSLDDEDRERFQRANIVDCVSRDGRNDVDYVVGLIRRIHNNQNIKLLIVDDSATTRHLVKQYLAAQRFQLLEADDGTTALEVLEEHPDVRLVVTDNQMPKMDGYGLISKLRERYSRHELAIIGISARGGSAISAQYLRCGANDFLTKPFSKEEFVCRINQNIELLELIQEMKESSNRDFLTNLYNRRYFNDVGDHYLENALRDNLSITVAMIDIDHFKVVNDTYGHDGGDLVLQRIASLLEDTVRKTDLVARMGGEEFCVLAVNLPQRHARQALERIRARIEKAEIDHEGRQMRVTVSIGATTRPSGTLSETLQAADEMLYRAKEDGRNRVVIAGDAPTLPSGVTGH